LGSNPKAVGRKKGKEKETIFSIVNDGACSSNDMKKILDVIMTI
jgi:hypothetical protein